MNLLSYVFKVIANKYRLLPLHVILNSTLRGAMVHINWK